MAASSDISTGGIEARPGDDGDGPAGAGGGGAGWRGPWPWTAQLLVASGVLLGAWTGYLAVSLPGRSLSWHYNIAWAGFDVLLLASVLSTAWLTHRRSQQAGGAATATAALLVADAWFDITTAAPGRPVHLAILMAVLVELPSAIFMIRTGQRSLKRRPAATTDLAPAAAHAGPQRDEDRAPDPVSTRTGAPQAQRGGLAA